MLALVEGRMHQFLRTRFKTSPVADWDRLWGMVEASLFNS